MTSTFLNTSEGITHQFIKVSLGSVPVFRDRLQSTQGCRWPPTGVTRMKRQLSFQVTSIPALRDDPE